MNGKLNPRFLPEVQAINQKITDFNQHLDPTYRVPLLDVDRMIEDGSCVQIVHGNWDAFRWPNPDKRGVYFILGREKTTDKNGMYIGKASFRSSMGARLDSHLRPHKNSEWFLMNGYNYEKYILDYMVTINLDCLNVGFLASALEEYLITHLKDSLKLTNGTGN